MQDTEFIKHIGKIIRFYRLKNNLTQEQLSEYADCSCGFIGQIERGESKISLSVLSKIINTLKIDANELFWDTDTHTSESHQLDNQIALYAKQLSIDKKHIVLNLMDDLKNLN